MNMLLASSVLEQRTTGGSVGRDGAEGVGGLEESTKKSFQNKLRSVESYVRLATGVTHDIVKL